MRETLQTAIEECYNVFSKYPLNSTMEGSPLYEDLQQWNNALTSKPLRELSGEDLSLFIFKAMSTWGTINDFKHYLPRILELTASLDSDIDILIVADKLSYCKWQTWPIDEIAVIKNWCEELWKQIITTAPEIIEVHRNDYIAGMAALYPHLTELLNTWINSDSENAMANFVCYVYWNNEELLQQKRLPALDRKHLQGNIFFEWITSADIIMKLESCYFKYEKSSFSSELSLIITMLENINS
jgi:hypothetical protein